MKKIGNIGDGGQGLVDAQKVAGEASLKELLIATRQELDDIRTKYLAIITKLDGEGTLGGGYVTAGTLTDKKFVE